MKKAFTFIEILIVIVILGILATITTKILVKVYENYYYSKELNKLSYQTDLVLNAIASKLTHRVKNSVIAVKCDIDTDGCISGNVLDFDTLSSVSDKDETERKRYKVLEWLGIDVYSHMGMWDDNFNRVIPGYSGFVDLKRTLVKGGDEYNITSPYTKFSIVEAIDSNWTAQFGISGNIFSNKYEVLIFSGSDDRGDFLEINNSYGYYSTPATRVFEITGYKEFNESNNIPDTNISIKAISISNSTTVYQKYYLVNSAYAIVPQANKDKDGNVIDYNLTLFYNYYPWNDQNYTDGVNATIASHVSQFKFKDENGVLRILVCINSPKIKKDSEPVTVCKEKVVF